MKRMISFLIVCLLALGMIHQANDVAVNKTHNRYYMLKQELARLDEDYDVQIYGSCHAYTSLDPTYLSKTRGLSAYNMANPSEIIPVTYLQMLEQFKDHAPQTVLVEIWGINPYETYIDTETILTSYLPSNIEQLPPSAEKQAVIREFENLDALGENFALAKYKSRLQSFSLTDVDYNYSYELLDALCNTNEDMAYIYREMESRFSGSGYRTLDSTALPDYPAQQATIAPGETLEIEPVILTYIDKIIALCDDYDVELIFYRAPYRSTANELRKANYLADYLAERSVPFFDLEKELTWDYTTDFNDYEHLSQAGATKATAFLCEKIS